MNLERESALEVPQDSSYSIWVVSAGGYLYLLDVRLWAVFFLDLIECFMRASILKLLVLAFYFKNLCNY